jgi:hypothetical protein
MTQADASIYLLQGSTGEYSDRCDWIVRAYVDKAKADHDCSMANTQAAEYFKYAGEDVNLRYPSCEDDYARDKALRADILLVDPDAQFDYTGSTYWVTACDLV